MPEKQDKRPAARRLLIVGLVALATCILLVALRVPVLDVIAGVLLVVATLLTSLWLLFKLYRVLLWRIGRRLAFTYFLIGVLPIPLVAAMLFVATYLLSGFFLGHLFRDGFVNLHEDLRSAARTRLAASQRGFFVPAAPTSPLDFAYYRNGRRIAGDSRAPEEWPLWLTELQDSSPTASLRPTMPVLISIDGTMSVAVALELEGAGVLAFFDGDLEADVSQRSGVWVDLLTADDPRKQSVYTLDFIGETLVLRPLRRPGAVAGREEFLQTRDPDATLNVIGFELAGPLYDLASGETLSPSVSATLTATPAIIRRHLLSRASEIDTLAWIGFVTPAFLLFDIYAVAAIMAVFLILGISRAVNRLSRATAAVQKGDFSVRIPVRRRDQIGALQTSFNEMAANLESLVAEAAKKERLEKELEIARDLQESLLPDETEETESVSFSTFFEPSAVIGGDYYDIIAMREERSERQRLAVVIADVSGHGLSAGLGMAMIKAGLQILVDQGKQPQDILVALDRLVRTSRQKAFVTATLAVLDLDQGICELTNAGHPPTYLLRSGTVQEILLPSPPLGALGSQYGTHTLRLEPGDILIWLSDGFIEATGNDGDSFGYERTRLALSGDAESPVEVRDRFLEAVRAHTEDHAAEDDCTLVVMRYQPQAESSRGVSGAAS